MENISGNAGQAGRVDTDKIKQSVDIADIIGRYIELKKDGREYKACCPFHEDKTPSLTVYEKNGVGHYHCFGCGAHGDVIDFITEFTGCTFPDAVQSLGGKLNCKAPVPVKSNRVDPYADYTPKATASQLDPTDAGRFDLKIRNPKRGGTIWNVTPQAIYPYPGQGYVIRVIMPDGKKITPMVRWCTHPRGSGWTLYPFDIPRTLYGYEPGDKQVLIVEGEKCADHARKLSDGKLCVVSWAGGCNGVDKTDWSLLRGRKIICWPDNDPSGFQAAMKIREIVAPNSESFEGIIPPLDAPKGWDVADGRWPDAASLFAWCKKHKGPNWAAVKKNWDDRAGVSNDTAKPKKQRKTAPKQPARNQNDTARSVLGNTVLKIAPKPPEQTTDDLNQAIETMNKNNAVVLHGDKCVVIRDMYDEDGNPEFRFIGMNGFHAYHENNQVWVAEGEKNRAVQVSRMWMRDKRRRTFDGVTFDPTGQAPETYLNLWKGYSVDPCEHGDWSLLKTHLLDNVCSGDKNLWLYLVTWMAQMFQQPDVKPGVMMVLKGNKGVGKTILSTYLQQILGNHAVKISRAEHLTGKFNAHLANRLLVAVEEGYWAGDKQADGPLKDLVTDYRVLVEKKGYDPIRVKNLMRILMTTNNDWVVPASRDERRYCVIEVGEKQKQNRKYFSAIDKQMQDGGLARMLHDLLHFDITQCDLNKIPQTQALNDQKTQSFEPREAYWYSVLNSEMIKHDGEHSVEYPINGMADRIPRREVYDGYLRFCRDIGYRRPVTDMSLMRKVYEMCPSIRHRGVRCSGVGRPWGIKVPNIQVARQEFDQYCGFKNEWPEDSEF